MAYYEDEVREPEAADAFHSATLVGFGALIFVGAAYEAPGMISVVFSVLALLAGSVTGLALRSGRRLQRAAELELVETAAPIFVEA